MTKAEKLDKLILHTSYTGTVWLKHIKGIGDAAMIDGEQRGLLTSQLKRPGGYGSRSRSMDHFITLTDAGIARKAILVAGQDRVQVEQVRADVLAAGPCPVCGKVAVPGQYRGWQCSDETCPAGRHSMTENLWWALVQRIKDLENP